MHVIGKKQNHKHYRNSDNSDYIQIYWNMGIYFFINDSISIDQRVFWVLTLILRGFSTIKFYQLICLIQLTRHLIALCKKRSFPLRIFSVNVTKFDGNEKFGHIYWSNPWRKTSFFCEVLVTLKNHEFLKLSRNNCLIREKK